MEIPFARIIWMLHTLVNMFDIDRVLCRAISILCYINIYIKKGGVFTIENVLFLDKIYRLWNVIILKNTFTKKKKKSSKNEKKTFCFILIKSNKLGAKFYL